MTLEELKQRCIRPPLVIFMPTPLVIPNEVIGAFLDAAEARGLLNSLENNQAPPPRLVCQLSDGHRAALEAVLQEQMALYQASEARP